MSEHPPQHEHGERGAESHEHTPQKAPKNILEQTAHHAEDGKTPPEVIAEKRKEARERAEKRQGSEGAKTSAKEKLGKIAHAAGHAAKETPGAIMKGVSTAGYVGAVLFGLPATAVPLGGFLGLLGAGTHASWSPWLAKTGFGLAKLGASASWSVLPWAALLASPFLITLGAPKIIDWVTAIMEKAAAGKVDLGGHGGGGGGGHKPKAGGDHGGGGHGGGHH